jgi:hypothetical protein
MVRMTIPVTYQMKRRIERGKSCSCGEGRRREERREEGRKEREAETEKV